MRRMFRAVVVLVLGTLFLLSVASRTAVAQVIAGLATISGIVRDSTGAVVPDAQVVVSNKSKGISITLHTTGGGVFNAPPLVPATGYAVTVEKQGFAKYEVKEIALAVGQDLNLVVTLTVASASTRVEVIGSAPLVDETKTDVSQVIDSRQIMDLPINGRRVDTFVLLTPGVTNDGNFGLLTFRGVANGNSFLLDGNDATEQFYGENNGRTRIASQISQDAVQEFQVVSANFSAEYGNAMGGVVNTVTRSGTNNYHGTAYYFYRNQDMVARDPFATVNPDAWRLQAGASVGGPIIKDKLFFFANGDFTRINSPIVDSYLNTNINSATQTFVPYSAANPATPLGCGDPATTVTPAQCSAINALLPRFFGLVPRSADQDLAFGRIDYHFSDKNTFSFSFNYMRFVSPNGLQQTLIASTSGGGVNNNGDDYARVRNGKATWTSILSSNLVNNFRYGYNTDLQGDNVNPGLNGALGFLDVSAAGVTLGAANYIPRVEPSETRNEIADDVSWTRGRHIFKFGMDFATTNDYSFFIQNVHGSYTYQNLSTFAEDFSGNATNAKNWASYTQTFGNPALNTRINYYGFYAADQWRATNRLTVNFGARYEYSQLPQPKVCNPAAPLTCHVNSQATNLMPRIGLAYRLGEKTVVRAGYGLFFARIMGATLQDLFTGNGVTTSSLSLSGSNMAQQMCGPVFPAIFPSPPACAATTSSNTIQFAAPNLKTPYSEQGVFAIEHEFSHNFSVTASYIWSRGIHLYSVFDTNLPPATNTTTATYHLENAAGALVGSYTTPVLLGVGGVSGARPNANFGGMYEDTNGVSSYYTGFTLQVQKRFSYGFQADISYTWSHEYDDGQGFGQANQNIFLSSANAWLVNGNYRLDMGDGQEDQPQRLVAALIWAPTFTHGSDAFSKYVLNNWEFSTIMLASSNRPYGSPTIRTSGTPVAGMFSNFSINGYGLSGRVPFLPVNSVLAPPTYRADIRISKIIPIGERYRLYLNLEAFNVSNTWSPTSVNTGAFTESSSVGTCGAGNTPCLKPVTFFGAGTGSGDALNPDGTEARRLQASVRFTF